MRQGPSVLLEKTVSQSQEMVIVGNSGETLRKAAKLKTLLDCVERGIYFLLLLLSFSMCGLYA